MRITKRDFSKLQSGLSVSKQLLKVNIKCLLIREFLYVDVIVVNNINYHLEFGNFLVKNFL